MVEYRPNGKRAGILQELVAKGVFRSSQAALDDAVDTYLSGLRQTPNASRFEIDPHPDNDAYRTQEQWIAFFNEQRKSMIPAAEVYMAGKPASDKTLQSSEIDFNRSWLVSSTRIRFDYGLSGIVTQNYGSRVVTPSRRNVSIIPVYTGTPLPQALQTKGGVDYLQAVFDTTDDPEAITGTLEQLSGRSASNIILWTPDQASRKLYPERAVGFVVDGVEFHVDGYYLLFGDVVRSLGMSVSSRNELAKK